MIVSPNDTVCISKWINSKSKEKYPETSLQISQVLLSRCFVDLLSFEISLCVFANFARGKRNLIREVLCRKKKFSYLCKQDFSDNKKAFLLIFGKLKSRQFQNYVPIKIRKERPRVYRGLFLFGT